MLLSISLSVKESAALLINMILFAVIILCITSSPEVDDVEIMKEIVRNWFYYRKDSGITPKTENTDLLTF